MVTILHLSDMQFGIQHRFGRLGLGGADEKFDTLLKRLTDDLDLLRESEGLVPDLVVLTGDLAEWARPKEYADVLQFCEGLRGYLKLAPDRLLVIPGNHDISRDKCLAYFADCSGDDREPVEPWWPKWGPYRDFFGKLYKEVDRYEFKETAPYTWFELPELKIVVAGLNSTMRESHKEKDATDPASIFGHYGYLGEAQLEWFKKKLDDAAAKEWLRIGLVHHNALRGAADDDENLRDAGLLKSRIGAQLNVLLHGHTHSGSIEWLDRALPVISTGSGAVKAAQRPEEVPNQYQIVQIHQDGFRCWARQYIPRRRTWIGDPSVSKDGSAWRHDETVQFHRTSGTFGARETRAYDNPGASKIWAANDADVDHRGHSREPDDLLAQVMASCRVRDESGRVQTVRVRDQGPWGDHCRVSDPARGTYMLGAHSGPLTPEALDLWVMDVHEPFWSRGNRGRTSDLVVASPEPFADYVKERAGLRGVKLWRRLDYENIIDTERWKKQQIARLDADHEYRRELYIEQRVTLWSPVEDVREPVHPAADRLAQMLCEGDGCFVMVLGPAGTGKTFLLREVARRITERQSIVTPLLVELRGLDRAQDVYELVNWEFARAKQILPPRAFERDLHEGRIALLFDGFDELAIRVRSAAIPEHFARILGAARERARVMVASRAEHFISQRDAVDTLMSKAKVHSTGLAGQLQAITQRRLVATRKFTYEDIEQYLARALGSPIAGRARMERFRKVHDLPGLAATPRMLSFLVRLTDEQLDLAAARRDAITSAELYHLVIVDHWLAQQAGRLNPSGSAPGPTSAALLESATRLALHLWRSTAKSIAANELDAHTGEQLRKLCEDDVDGARQTLQGRTLLTHGEGGGFEFVHQTVMEWLVAQALAVELTGNGTSADLEHGRLDDFMVDVLRELLHDDVLAAWAKRVLEGVPGNRLAENARFALACMKREVTVKWADLRGQDLRGQSLEGQDLRGALLDGADLRGVDLTGRDLRGASMKGAKLAYASLRGADLTDVDLEGADLSFARLDHAKLEQVRLTAAVLLATRALGARGTFVRMSGRFAESAAWEVDVGAPSWSIHRPSKYNAVAFSPDGRLLASGDDEGTLELWDAEKGVLLRVLEGHTLAVMSVAWSPDGTCIATGSGDKTVRIWQALTGHTLRTMEGHIAGVIAVAWSPDSISLASGSADMTVRVWEVGTGQVRHILHGHTGSVRGVAWNVDGTRLASGSGDKMVRVWEVGTGQSVGTLEGHTDWVRTVAWSPDGTHLASGSDDHTVRVWNAETGQTLRVLLGHTSWVMSVAWSPDGARIATGSGDYIVRVWEVGMGQSLRNLQGHTGWVMGVSWSPDGTRLASGADDGTLRVWEVGMGQALWSLEDYRNGVLSVSWSPDGNRFASGSDDKTVRVWEADMGQALRPIKGHTGSVMSVSWSPDATCLASGSEDKMVRVWEARTGQALHTFVGHKNWVRGVSWSPDGTRLASGSDDKTVRVWDVGSSQTLYMLEGHTKSVRSVAWSPDGARLVSGSDDKTLRVWEARTGKTLRIINTNIVKSVSWSSNGRHIASGCVDGTVRVWDAGMGRALRPLAGHKKAVTSVAWSPDGACLVSGSDDRTVRVWEAMTGRVLAVLSGHLGQVSSVGWGSDGKSVVSAGFDGTLRIWDVASKRCLAIYVATPDGAVTIRPRDGRYRIQGDPGGRFAHSIGLARYELGELDEFIEGGLRLSDDEPVF